MTTVGVQRTVVGYESLGAAGGWAAVLDCGHIALLEGDPYTGGTPPRTKIYIDCPDCTRAREEGNG